MRLGKKKYLSHVYRYQVDGEILPDKEKRSLNKKAVLIAVFIPLFLLMVIHFLTSTAHAVLALASTTEFSLLDVLFGAEIDISEALRLGNFFSLPLPLSMYVFLILLAMVVSLLLYGRFNYKDEDNIAYGQKGDSRFTTIEEIQAQYKEIPNKSRPFEGIGGIPISHYKNRYYIDCDPVNTCLVGVSRSGKDEVIIGPMIDIISRAEEKASMIICDPKGEQFAASKELLEKRGYDVQVLNLQDPMQSMSYNPLQFVIDAWLAGDEHEASKRASTIAHALYNDPDAGKNKFFYDGAKSAVTAIILALVEHSTKSGCPEKITMHNVAEMLSELGAFNYKEHPQALIAKNALDEFFASLPQGHVAKKRYGDTSFAGREARGSILSTAIQKLQPFVDSSFAKMTSKSSVDMKQVGFPKSLYGQLDDSFVNQRLSISFHKNTPARDLLGAYTAKVKWNGMYALNFSETLEAGDLVLVKCEDRKLIYEISFSADGETEARELVNTFSGVHQSMKMRYSDKPTAIFMIIPDADSSNHTLATIFVKQLYTELSQNCLETRGKKCFNRAHFILNEFGNMPPIDDMDQIMTVCLGKNILFTLVVQSYSQIKHKYGDAAETIKENCQNHIYIMSTNPDTLEEVSKKAGHKTLVSRSSREGYLRINNEVTKSADQVRLITTDRLSQLIIGETVVIRSLHRQDTQGRKVRPFPIFNTQETNMPYRYEFLSDYLDTSKDLNEIAIPSEHTDVALPALQVDYLSFFVHEVARQKYMQANGIVAEPAKEVEKWHDEPDDDIEHEPEPPERRDGVTKKLRGKGSVYDKE